MAITGPEEFLLTCWAVRSVTMLTFEICGSMTTQKMKHGQQVTQLATFFVNGLRVKTTMVCDYKKLAFTI